jgi:peptide chain release factor 1
MSANVPHNLLSKLEELNTQFEAIGAQLLEPEVMADHKRIRSLSIKRAALEPIVVDFRAYREAVEQIADARAILAEDGDGEMADLAREEIAELEGRSEQLIEAVQKRLVLADDQSVGSVIMEIRAGVGGDEAGIWAGDLLEMYRRFAARKKWTVEDMESSPSEMGGVKLAIITLRGEAVWSQLGYEGGTHQVKRVPATEAQGRIHTSTATVAVLPEPEDIEIELNRDDVKENITTAQGPGGQNVNKVATAVHLIHEPTGVEVRMQDTKSQAQNREKAWQLLRARLYERQKQEAEAERAESRSSMIGSGGRAEKIRTYRYKENLAVDHRIGASFNLGELMAGNMQSLIDALVEHDTAQRLAAL